MASFLRGMSSISIVLYLLAAGPAAAATIGNVEASHRLRSCSTRKPDHAKLGAGVTEARRDAAACSATASPGSRWARGAHRVRGGGEAWAPRGKALGAVLGGRLLGLRGGSSASGEATQVEHQERDEAGMGVVRSVKVLVSTTKISSYVDAVSYNSVFLGCMSRSILHKVQVA